ncbi:MAG: ABC transporter permease [Bacteroidales bacterium]|nr:ABC transporter permease [Bacteroidales bacterium]
MLKHYIKSSLRSISRHRLFSVINILGLAIGLSCFLVIFRYVQDELKYDAFHEDSEDVYRIIKRYKKESGGGANLPGVLESKLKGNIPQAEAISSFYRDHQVVIGHSDQQFPEKALYFTDPEMFDILSLRLATGDPAKALDGPFKMVITKKMVRKYFGDQPAIGQTLTVDNEHTYQITGILESLPEQSHLEIDFMASLSSLKQLNKWAYTHWGFSNSSFYLKLSGQADAEQAEQLINDIYFNERGEKYTEYLKLDLQPLEQIYLHSSDLEYDIAQHSNIRYVRGFAALAIFILLIVGFNYMNLSTARMSLREKEIGMRKIVGAERKKIIAQFMGESFVFTLASAVLALLLVHTILPVFNEISGKTLGRDVWHNSQLLMAFAGIILFMTLFAGSYPALILSRIRPLAILGGAGAASYKTSGGPGGHLRFRQALVFLQFAISIFLIVAALVIYKQIHYIQNKNLGINKEQIAIIKNPYNKQKAGRYKAFTDRVKNYPEVRGVSSTFSAPPHLINNFTRLKSAGASGKGKKFGIISVNYGYFETLGAQIIKGRSFSTDYGRDAQSGVILNETGARLLGKAGLLNEELTGFYNDQQKKVVGIVRDIHFLPMQKKMPPLAFVLERDGYPSCYPEILVKLDTRDIRSAVGKLQGAWEEVAPGWPFQLEFMDQKFDAQYRSEQKVKNVVTVFTVLAISLSLLGLFGLAAFSVDRRMREIGIRKAMGAQMTNIAALFSGEFLRWIVVSNLIAWPAAYWVMKGWLNNYVYKTGLSLWVFLAAAGAAVLVTALILAYQTLKAGRANPAAILREE